MPEQYVPGMSAAPDISLLTMAIYMAAALTGVVGIATLLGVLTLPLFYATTFALEGILLLFQTSDLLIVRVALMMFRSLRRNVLRTSLTYVALFVFTFVLALIFSIVTFLRGVTKEKEQDVKVIMTEKFQVPSQMKPSYTGDLIAIMKKDLPPEMQPKSYQDDVMSWGFVGGSLDPVNKTFANSLFMFAMEPHSLTTMMDGLMEKDVDNKAEYAEFLTAVDKLKQDKRNVLIGKDKLKQCGKNVGDEIRVYGWNYKDIIFEYKIVGTFPDGRYNNSAVMRLDYLLAKLDDYKATKGTAHPQAERCVNLVWVRLPNKAAYERLATLVNEKNFNAPAVKLETASAGIGSFLDAYKDILFGVEYILMPALAVIMGLVVSITMTIAIRERRTEMAVLKVLGFPPWHILGMILGEGILVGFLSGFICTWFCYFLIWIAFPGGIPFPVAFFGTFMLSSKILYYGPLLGALAAGFGTFLPARNGSKVKASDVFSQVA